MNWIKRNKFFALALILALGMLGAAGYYDWQSWSLNEAKFDHLDDIYKNLRNLTGKRPSPGNDAVDNIATAQQQASQLNAWNRQARNYFQPIEPIPPNLQGGMRGNRPSGVGRTQEFAQALSRTIAQMQHDAAAANVTLPPDYGFSFTAERNRVNFAPGSLGPLSEQLGAVKTVTEILYAAQINTLEGVQRVRVSDDDTAGPQSDYIAESPTTSDQAILTPWQITFSAFSPEIAKVLAGFAASPHGIIVKGINVQRAEAADIGQSPADNRFAPPAGASPGRDMSARGGRAGRGGLQTVLDEHLLRVTIEIEIVKLSPGN